MNDDVKNFFEKNDYVIISNFLHEQLVFSHYSHMLDIYENDLGNIDTNQVENSYIHRDDIVFDTLLSKMCPIFSEITGKNLVPTYAFCRLYLQGQELEKHTDRESCEYSATMTLGYKSDYKLWPLFLKNKNGKKIKARIEIGDALLYKGQEQPHWRKPLKGNHHIQLFLHYVDSDGPHKDWIFDKRPGLHSLDYEVNTPILKDA